MMRVVRRVGFGGDRSQKANVLISLGFFDIVKMFLKDLPVKQNGCGAPLAIRRRTYCSGYKNHLSSLSRAKRPGLIEGSAALAHSIGCAQASPGPNARASLKDRPR